MCSLSTTILSCGNSRASISPRHAPRSIPHATSLRRVSNCVTTTTTLFFSISKCLKLDGFVLLEEIRSNERFKHLPVIMLTGHDDIVSIDRAYQIGANSFATKPVNWRQLSYQIRYVVRTSGRRAARGPRLRATTAMTNAMRDFLQSVVHRAGALRDQSVGAVIASGFRNCCKT